MAQAVARELPQDPESMLDSLRATHTKLTAAYAEFNKVMDMAERMWPKQEPHLGVAAHCRHCDRPYAERRDTPSPEYGFCSVPCYQAEVVG